MYAPPGRYTTTLRRLFNALGAERCAQITHVSADAAVCIADVVAEAARRDPVCRPVHVVAWATRALDAERRRASKTHGLGPRLGQMGSRSPLQ